MLVSVIVPVYKAEKWIHRCVDSILAQTMEDFELLLIDDGSPDRSGEICDEYAVKDSRVRVFHKENGGEVSARYEGWKNMSGEYLMFVDSDDVLSIDALESMLSFMSDEVNIVCGKMMCFDDSIKPNVDNKEKININVVSYIEYCKNVFYGNAPLSLCGKLYRKRIVTYNIFDIPREIKKGPDAIGSARIAFNNDKDVLFIDKVVYFYRQHVESCIHTFETSSEYEQMFYDNLWKSVPKDKEKEYIKYLIYYKIKTFDKMFGYSADVPSWIGSVFHKNLLYEIDEHKYKSLLIERLLLVVTNRTIREILIFLKRVKNTISFRLKRLWKNL